MRRKIGTALHEHLIVDMKELARKQGVPLNELLEEAIIEYLYKRRGTNDSYLKRTKGSVRLPPQVIDDIMKEDLHAGD